MIDERMRIEYPPMSPRLIVASGSTVCLPMSMTWSISGAVASPGVDMPDVGNQWSSAAKMMISGMPITKYGIE